VKLENNDEDLTIADDIPADQARYRNTGKVIAHDGITRSSSPAPAGEIDTSTDPLSDGNIISSPETEDESPKETKPNNSAAPGCDLSKSKRTTEALVPAKPRKQ
jgi:hypothetical protein